MICSSVNLLFLLSTILLMGGLLLIQLGTAGGEPVKLTVRNPSSKPLVPACEWFAGSAAAAAAGRCARPCWLSLARQKSLLNLSRQPEIWTGRVQDDGFRELGMEEKPVSIDPTVNKVEKAEN